MEPTSFGSSPRWNSMTKLVVALTFITIAAGLVVRFQSYLGPLLMTFILAYLFYSPSKSLTKYLKLPWRLSVTLIYLLVVIVFLGLLTLGGLALFDQLQSLITLIQNALVTLPDFLNHLQQTSFAFGPFKFSLAQYDFAALTNQILSVVQPLLGELGNLVGRLASGAAGVIGTLVFILLISYFILTETGGISGKLIDLQIPGYAQDFNRLGVELGRTWNAFLRGQLILFGLTAILYMVILSMLGLRYSIGLAFLAGFGRFIPYLGPAIAWTTYALVAYFQGTTLFGLPQFTYVVLVVGIALIVDNVFDSFVTPRVMAQALSVHPAAVLVAAVIGANLLGIVGVLLAAPVLATVKLIGTYGLRKLFDQDPWEGFEKEIAPPPPTKFSLRLKAIWAWITSLYRRIQNARKK